MFALLSIDPVPETAKYDARSLNNVHSTVQISFIFEILYQGQN